ncbi:MAG: methyltransferase domain-containing protein [Actinobacteria bacterium]|nr:methyltransferase domain-containing protein [Actinomycetota bacterium]
MSGLRDTIRRVPFATEIYESTTAKAKMVSSRKQVRAILSSGAQIKLDLGGGYQPGRNGWINVDISREADLFWDLRHGIPFPDSSVDHVYSSHLFEHLTYAQGQGLLDESMRVLKPGGSFSIVVPNARMYIEAYLGKVELPAEYFGWTPAYNNTTGIDAINYIAYMAGEHTYMFDQENLLHILSGKGFERVVQRAFDPATDLIERDYESIYAIGYKPA